MRPSRHLTAQFFSPRSNQRYPDALATASDTTPCARILDAVSRPVIDGGRRYRAQGIGDPDDLTMLQVIARGEFATAGFRTYCRPALQNWTAEGVQPGSVAGCPSFEHARGKTLRAHDRPHRDPRRGLALVGAITPLRFICANGHCRPTSRARPLS